MKKNQLIMLIVILVISIIGIASVLIGSVFFCETVNNKMLKGKINVLGYRAAEEVNANGYQITKYDNVQCSEWIDNDNILISKDNGYLHNPGENILMSTFGKYNLNSKETKDYADVVMESYDFHGISPSGRYALYGEPRKLYDYGTEEWKKAEESKELFHQKRDILDLETGEIIVDFDKVINNCSADYKWMNNDFIFVDYGGEWAILNRQGKSLKRGTFKHEDGSEDGTELVDVAEVEVLDEEISGCFYYTKDFMGSDGNLLSKLFSMDVNTLEEKLIYSCDHSMDYSKHGDVITLNYFENNGGANEDGVYLNRTFAFRAVSKDGTLLQDFGFPDGRNFRNLTLSPDGKKCAFIEVDAFMKNGEEQKKDNVLNNTLKVMDIRTGEVKEIAKVEDLMDKNNEEEFISLPNIIAGDGEVKTMRGQGPLILDIKWNRTGDSLSFNYRYTSKNDGYTYTNTYIVTFYK